MTKVVNPVLEYISPDDLLFDSQNPRFAGTLQSKSQADIQSTIYGAPHYASELVDSFIENGYIDYEPLVAKRHSGKFIVLEGNRRLAAIKQIRGNLSNYPSRRSDFATVPVIIFPDNKQENEVRVYLGVRHLLGFREWPPLAKAEFLHNESQKQGGLEQVIREVQLTRQQVRRFLVPFRLLKVAKIDLPAGEDFWVLGEALQRSGVKKFLQLEVNSDTMEVVSYQKTNLKLLLDDLYGPREASVKQRDVSAKKVHDTRDLSTYASVLSSEKATSVLHSGRGLSEAAIYVDTREQSQTRLKKIVKELGVLLRKLMPPGKVAEAVAVHRAFKELEAAVKAYLKKHA